MTLPDAANTLELRGIRPLVSTTTRKTGRPVCSPRSSRAVSLGLSFNTVPAPTTTASDIARISCARCRAISPVIHCESPEYVAIFPSRLIANLAVTNGQAGANVLAVALDDFQRLPSGFVGTGCYNVDTCGAEQSETLAADGWIRVLDRTFDPGDAEFDYGVGAGRGNSLKPVRLQRADKCAAARRVAGRVTMRAATSAWWPGLACVRPSPTALPPLTTTAPTGGRGATPPAACLANSMARRRNGSVIVCM